MKRSLIILLVLAMIGTMIPSLAMADEPVVQPTFELVLAEGETKDITQKLEYNGNTFASRHYRVTGLSNCYVIWKSDNTKCAAVDPHKADVNEGEEELLTIYFEDVGTATITGTLYNQYDEAQLKPIEIKVTLEEIPVAKVSFTKGVPAKAVEGHTLNLENYVNLKSNVKDAEGNLYTPTDGPESISWSVDKEELASITNRGVLTCKKAGSVIVTAKAKSGVSSATKVEITAEREETPDPEQEVYYSSIELSTSRFEIARGQLIYPKDYITVAPADANDELVFTSDNEKVAEYTLSEHEYWDDDEQEWIPFYMGAIMGKQEGTAHITVASKYNPDCPSKVITVTVVKPEPFADLSFKKSAITMDLGDGLSIEENYLNTKRPTKNFGDHLVWSSSDQQVVSIDENGYANAKKVGAAKITVRSYLRPELKAHIDVEVKDPAKEGADYKALTFIEEKLSMVIGDGAVDLYQYLNQDPLKEFIDRDQLVWTSAAPAIATVDEDGHVTALRKGTAVITVRSKRNADATPGKITIEVKEEDKAKLIDEISFVESAITIRQGDEVPLQDYMNVKPVDWKGDEIIWTSSEPRFARVDDAGYVFGKDVGATVITARSKKNPSAKAGTITINVEAEEEKAIKSITPIQTAIKMLMNDTGTNLERYLKIEPKDYEDILVWTSSDPQFVEVSNEGKVNLKDRRPGTATITVRSLKNPEATASIEVTLEKEALKKISFTKSVPTEMTTRKGGIELYKYLDTDPWYYATLYKDELVFESSDPQVAGFRDSDDAEEEDTKVLYAYSIGKTTISVHAKDDESVRASFALTVKAIPVQSAAFAKTSFTLPCNDSLYMGTYLNIKPLDASYDDLNWQSSNPAIADFEDGSYSSWLYGYKAGTVTVTATIRNQDGSVVTASAKVKVTDKAAEKIAFKAKSYTVNLTNEEYGPSYRKLYLVSTPADADIDWDTVHVETSNAEIATVSQPESDGAVTVYGIKPGKVKITATSADKKFTATTKVTVKAVALTAVGRPGALKTINIPLYDVTLDNYYRGMNETEVHVNVKPSNAYYVASWKSTKPGVAFVVDGMNNKSRYAKIRAVAPGKCTIKVTLTNGKTKITKSFTIIVKAATVFDLALNKTKYTGYIIKGGDNTLQLTATDSKTDAVVPVTWKTSNKKIATVNKKGLVTFKAAGKVKITATTVDGNNTKKTCTLTIKKLKVTKVTPARKAFKMKVGDTAALKITVKPSKAFNPAVSFKSSDSKVVSVDAKGNVVALKPGKAVITITAKDGSKKSCKVTITVIRTASNGDDVTANNENNIGLSLDGIDGIESIDGLIIDAGDSDALVLN